MGAARDLSEPPAADINGGLMSAVIYEKQGHIGIVTINRPDARNAISPEVGCRLVRTWEEIHDDDSIRVAVVTGAGTEAFCAGADLARLIPLFTGVRQPEDEWDRTMVENPMNMTIALLRDYDIGKPLVAAINGSAIAGGMEVALAADLRVAARHAKFGLQEVKWAVFPAGGSTVRLPRQMPYAHAMELLLTGELIDAERAYELGLLNRLVAAEAVFDTAMELAEKIAANGPIAVREVRRSVRYAIGRPEQEGLQREAELAQRVFATRDAQEGPRAFIEKRKPRFEGR